jgi:hypothetical protein
MHFQALYLLKSPIQIGLLRFQIYENESNISNFSDGEMHFFMNFKWLITRVKIEHLTKGEVHSSMFKRRS